MTPPADAAIRRALGAHEWLRRLGVPAASIYVALDREQLLVTAVPVAGRGPTLVVGSCRLGDEAFAACWADAVRWWNAGAGNDPECAAVWRAFQQHIECNPAAIGVYLLVAGATWPQGEA